MTWWPPCPAPESSALSRAAPEDLAVAITWLDDHVGDRRYGVDVIVPAKYLGDIAGQQLS